MGLVSRRDANEVLRGKGVEPAPGWDAGIKRVMRYLKRVPKLDITVKNPEKYLNASRTVR